MKKDASRSLERTQRVYILRLWREPGPRQAAWRFSLEDPLTRQRRGFADLESLTAFLEEQMRAIR